MPNPGVFSFLFDANASGAESGIGQVGSAIQGLVGKIKGLFDTLTNFNTLARVSTSAFRAIGTSMIFAGGAFRDLGVAINVAASLFQTFIPIIQAVLDNLGALSYLLAPLATQLGLAAAGMAVFGAATAAVVTKGVEFNAQLETTQLQIATMIAEYKNLFDAQGNQIGKITEQMTAQEKQTAVMKEIEAGLVNAKLATIELTVAAAQSLYTTQQLLPAFQAVYASLGQYNVSTSQASNLTVLLAQAAAVAKVPIASLGAQFSLFLAGAGRVTSGMQRLANSVGLTREFMRGWRQELAAARGDAEKSATVVEKLTSRIEAFGIGGNLISNTWQGIMSNLAELFDIFAGTVTEKFFNTIKNAFYELQKDVQGNVVGVTGVLTKLFNYDPNTGMLAKGISSFSGIFNKNLDPLIKFFTNFLNTIAPDVVTFLNFIVDSIIKVGQVLLDNQDTIAQIWDLMKGIGELILVVIDEMLHWMGVATDGQGIIETIRKTFAFIVTVIGYIIDGITIVRSILWTFKPILDLIVNNFKELWNLGSLIADVFRVVAFAIAGQWDMMASAATDVANRVKDIGSNWSKISGQIAEDSKNAAELWDNSDAGRKLANDILVRAGGKSMDRSGNPAGNNKPYREEPKPRDDDAAKKGKEVADIEKGYFKEVTKVLESELEVRRALIERAFNSMKDGLDRLSDVAEEQYKANQRSIISSGEMQARAAIQGIQFQIDKLNELELVRKASAQRKMEEIDEDAKRNTENYEKQRAAAIANGANESKLAKIKTDYLHQQTVLAFNLTSEQRQNTADEIKYTGQKEILEASVTDEVRKRNAQRKIELQDLDDSIHKSAAEVEAYLNAGVKARAQVIDDESRTGILSGLALIKDLQQQLSEGQAAGLSPQQLSVLERNVQTAQNNLDVQIKLNQEKQLQLRIDAEELVLTRQKQVYLVQIDESQQQLTDGIITQEQATKRAADAALDYQAITRQSMQNLLDYGAAVKDTRPDITAEIQKIYNEWSRLSEITDQNAVELRKSFRDGFTGFFEDIQSNIRNVGDAFTKLGQSILKTFQSLIAKKLSEQLFDSLFGNGEGKKGIAGGLIGILSKATGGVGREGPALTGVAANADIEDAKTTLGRVFEGASGSFANQATSTFKIVADAFTSNIAPLAATIQANFPNLTAAINSSFARIGTNSTQDIHQPAEVGPLNKASTTANPNVSTVTQTYIDGQSQGIPSVFMPLLDDEGKDIILVPSSKLPAAVNQAKGLVAGLMTGNVGTIASSIAGIVKTFASKIVGFLGALFGGGGTTSVSVDSLIPIPKADGGYISGPGGPTDDKIPAWLSNGEFVIQAAAVRALGLDKLSMLNNAHKMPNLPRFDTGGLAGLLANIGIKGGAGGNSTVLGGGTLGNVAGIAKGFNFGALKGDAVGAAISIGLALLGRLFAKKQPKSDPNRTPDPFGLNPDSLTFYKHPIISGSRNYLAKGGLITSAGVLASLPKFATGGEVLGSGMGDIVGSLQGAGDNVNINNRVNINTPDIHSFRKSRASIEKEFARISQRGLKRSSPKY